MLRETARYFGQPDDADSHPVGHVWKQLNDKRGDLDGMLDLFRQIKNGPEGKPAGDKKCSVLQLIDAPITYRDTAFGHGASRESSFYEEEMGPLMFPAVNDLLTEGTLNLLGPNRSRLVLVTEIKANGNGKADVELRKLIGLQSERAAPTTVDSELAAEMQSDRLALLWPGRESPVSIDPSLALTENEITEDVQFLNRDRGGIQAEYLSYATGSTQRDKEMAATMAKFFSLLATAKVTEMQLPRMALENDVPRLRTIDPHFDRDLEAIVARATERRAEDRIQSAQELAGYLERYLEAKPIPIRTPGLAEMIGRWMREHKPLVATDSAHLPCAGFDSDCGFAW